MQGHAVSPYWCSALDNDQRATGDVRQWRERLGWGDGGGDGDGIYHKIQIDTFFSL